jgi:hypothetical protein
MAVFDVAAAVLAFKVDICGCCSPTATTSRSSAIRAGHLRVEHVLHQRSRRSTGTLGQEQLFSAGSFHFPLLLYAIL